MRKKPIPDKRAASSDGAVNRARPDAAPETLPADAGGAAAQGVAAPRDPKAKKKKKGSKRA